MNERNYGRASMPSNRVGGGVGVGGGGGVGFWVFVWVWGGGGGWGGGDFVVGGGGCGVGGWGKVMDKPCAKNQKNTFNQAQKMNTAGRPKLGRPISIKKQKAGLANGKSRGCSTTIVDLKNEKR